MLLTQNGSQTTGQRCTCAILDDVDNRSSSVAFDYALLKQERVAHAVTEMESIIKAR